MDNSLRYLGYGSCVLTVQMAGLHRQSNDTRGCPLTLEEDFVR